MDNCIVFRNKKVKKKRKVRILFIKKMLREQKSFIFNLVEILMKNFKRNLCHYVLRLAMEEQQQIK